jgi:hypothetical protein
MKLFKIYYKKESLQGVLKIKTYAVAESMRKVVEAHPKASKVKQIEVPIELL